MTEPDVQLAVEADGWVVQRLTCPVTGTSHVSVHCALAMELECPHCGGWHVLEGDSEGE